MADPKPAAAAGSEEADVFLSASEDEAVQQQVVTPELLSALVKQVEFYFSDANLPTDKKLLKQIRKDPDGYVPVKLFANFRKVRALSKDVGIITEALRSATLLQLSQDGKRVKRIVTVPEYDISDIQRRTIVVENLPGNSSPTIESVTEMFRVYGTVKLVRICSRESKGKLPSWLTSSCQNMSGQQHAYVEFAEEDGAILASAALASESDAPDGAVQVRRLLACIAEQRDRRSVNGNGCSFGGSSGGGASCISRKGSRDVSPMGSGRNANSRRNSAGGASAYGTMYGNYSSGGSSCWTASSSGGAGPDAYHHPHHNQNVSYHHHSYGGAFEHGGNSRRGSAGGMVSSTMHLPPPPPPPPPPRRSCDSAPTSELLSGAAAAAPALLPLPAMPSSGCSRSSGVYRPPAKRISDGSNHSHGGVGATPGAGHCPVAGSSPNQAMGSAQQAYNRSLCGSFTGSCGGHSCGTAGSVGSGSAVSTPVIAPSSPPLPLPAPSPTGACAIQHGVALVAHSPPLLTRGASLGGGRPPVHPSQSAQAVATAPPPPPPPPAKTAITSGAASPIAVAFSEPQPVPVATAGSATTTATLPPSSLAEAIAQAQADRRASEAGMKGATISSATSALQPGSVVATAAVAAATKACGPSAPKFCLDLGAGFHGTPFSQRVFSRQSSSSSLQESGPSGEVTPAAIATPATAGAVTSGKAAAGAAAATTGGPASVLTRGSQAQMVANVEDFINNILARPAARPTPVPAAVASTAAGGSSGPAGRKSSAAGPSSAMAAAAAAAAAGAVTTPRASVSVLPQADSAAATVAGILASTLRRASIATTAPAASPKVGPHAPRNLDSPKGTSEVLAKPPTSGAAPTISIQNYDDSKPSDPAAAVVHGVNAGASDVPQAPARPTVHIAAIAAGDADGVEDGGNPVALLQSYGMQSYGKDVLAAGGDCKVEDKVAAPVQAPPKQQHQQQVEQLAVQLGADMLGPFLTPRGYRPPAASCPNSALVATLSVSASNTPERPASARLSGAGHKIQGGDAAQAGVNGSRATAALSAGSAAQPLTGRPGAKRLSRREYAQWAAATPGFRAEAASKYGVGGPAGGAGPKPLMSGGQARSSGGGMGLVHGGMSSPGGASLASISDGGVFVGPQAATGLGAPTSQGQHSSHGSVGAIWHVARGPDGSRGFAGRARPMAV